MFWIILLGILWVIFLIILETSMTYEWYGVAFIIFFCLLFSPLLLIIAPQNKVTDDTAVQEIKRIEIYNGRLTSHIIGGDLVYEYATKDADGGFSLHTMLADGIKVYPDVEENIGYIITYEKYEKGTFWKLSDKDSYIEIHIPKK